MEGIGQDYGLNVEFVRADYADSLSLFSSGSVDAVVMTNIDAASIVAAAGIASDVILVGSFSNGNDAILLKGDTEDDIRGKRLGLVEFSVSHYLIDRYLEKQGIGYDEVTTTNINDSAIASIFASTDTSFDGAVTWNPVVDELLQRFGAKVLFDSSSIPFEIADLLVINRSFLEKNPQAAQALLEIWFEVTGRISKDPEKLWLELGALSGTSAEGYKRQIDKTILVDAPESAAGYQLDPRLHDATDEVISFVERHQLVKEQPSGSWITVGDDEKGLLHYDLQPLQKLVD